VRILATTSNNKMVSGTGVIISGVGVLTCYHVVEDARSIQVLLDGRSPYADVVVQKISPIYDLALLSVRGLPTT
jgi:S1-C subfamily serine protease